MTDWTLLPGDCRRTMRLCVAPDSVDSIVTDPPYDLTSIVKRFGGPNAKEAQYGTDGAFQRASGGFMNMTWDGSGVAFDPDTWREAYRVLKPGGHLIAFGGSRTYHRLACAIEDAGFEIRDQIMWLYGSGFPKSHNVAVAVDKQAGVPSRGKAFNYKGRGERAEEFDTNGRDRISGYAPATDAARQWEGWGTALKPAHEPIVLARKPLVGTDGRSCTVAANVLAHGTGAINIDGCRVEARGRPLIESRADASLNTFGDGLNGSRAAGTTDQGRFPANVMHDGSEEVLAGFPDAPGALRPVGPEFAAKSGTTVYGDYGPRPYLAPRGDSGSAARFFANCQMDDAEWLDQSLQLDSANIADGRLSLQNLFDGFARGPAAIWACPGAKVSLNIQIPHSMNATLTESRQIAETLIGAIQHTVSAFWQESPPERLSLLLNNVQFVAEAGPTGIILTIPALSISSGFVGLVIFNITPTNWEAGAKDSVQFTASFKYCAKASKADREEGLADLPLVAAGMVSEDSGQQMPHANPDAERPKRANHHPTVKPTALMRYLCRLVTPPGGTVLDPFTGSGSTGKAALLGGFSFIGCEMTPEYIPIAEARLAHALAQFKETTP